MSEDIHQLTLQRNVLAAIVEQFLAHYPVGINPFLDSAYRLGRDVFSGSIEGINPPVITADPIREPKP